ncbi:MAG TPA: hypothetical protein VKB23_02810 [Solirubrobacterales bacterium]|nr:hypothetical protein [Solirubrobacterales bacterium]
MTVALTFLGGLVAGAFVALLTHRFTSRRDHAKRRSEMRIQFLLGAYRALADASNRGLHGSTSDARVFEQALEDIQLLGSRAQAQKAKRVAEVMASEGGASTDDLLTTLRNDLRAELGLSALADPPVHLRIIDQSK